MHSMQQVVFSKGWTNDVFTKHSLQNPRKHREQTKVSTLTCSATLQQSLDEQTSFSPLKFSNFSGRYWSQISEEASCFGPSRVQRRGGGGGVLVLEPLPEEYPPLMSPSCPLVAFKSGSNGKKVFFVFVGGGGGAGGGVLPSGPNDGVAFLSLSLSSGFGLFPRRPVAVMNFDAA